MTGIVCAVTQSNYLPWRGYFDLIRKCDHVIFLDDVQYTRRDWRNRNRIKTPNGPKWISVPVNTKGRFANMRVCEAVISEPGWKAQHLASIQNAYRTAPHFESVIGKLETWFSNLGSESNLSAVNRSLIENIADYFGLDCRFSWSWDHIPLQDLDQMGSSQRLLELCQKICARAYISGPAAKAYLDQDMFVEAEMGVEWMDYASLPSYPQINGSFESSVSIVDYMMMQGSQFWGVRR